MVRADFDPSTKNVAISGKLRASEEGNSEKYSESGSGAIQMQSVDYNGTDVIQTLTANGIKVKEYKGSQCTKGCYACSFKGYSNSERLEKSKL